ncbi:endospore germination permease [Paenibacillus sp. NPDC058071]|uniref:GerAB/ArcD/ProY family transporter n=1 Tax=Paenibacillus sp. NPDC058071 TaxID=3346326 RepID=UPI0036DF257F
MKDQMKMSPLQLALLVIAIPVASNMVSLPMALTDAAKQDAWIAFLMPIPYGIFIAYLFWKLCGWMPGKNMYEIVQQACGKWIGGLLNGMLLLFLLLDIISQIRLYSDFFSASILLKTPPEYMVLATMLLLMYIATGTTEHLARANVVFIALFILIYSPLPFLFLNEIDITKLEPVMTRGIVPTIRGGILATGSFGDIIVLGAFLHHVRKPRDIYFAVKAGVIFSCFMLTLWLLCVVSVISPMLASRLAYIGWILVQQIHVTDFLDRVDLFLISLYVPVILMKFGILYTAILTGFASYTKKKKFDFINILAALCIGMLTILLFNNTEEVTMFTNFGIIPITFGVQIVYIGCLLIGVALRRKLFQTKVMPSEQQNNLYGLLVWLSLIVCASAVVFGSVAGGSRGVYGIIAGIVYACFLLLVVYFSIKEFGEMMKRQARDHNSGRNESMGRGDSAI